MIQEFLLDIVDMAIKLNFINCSGGEVSGFQFAMPLSWICKFVSPSILLLFKGFKPDSWLRSD